PQQLELVDEQCRSPIVGLRDRHHLIRRQAKPTQAWVVLSNETLAELWHKSLPARRADEMKSEELGQPNPRVSPLGQRPRLGQLREQRHYRALEFAAPRSKWRRNVGLYPQKYFRKPTLRGFAGNPDVVG